MTMTKLTKRMRALADKHPGKTPLTGRAGRRQS